MQLIHHSPVTELTIRFLARQTAPPLLSSRASLRIPFTSALANCREREAEAELMGIAANRTHEVLQKDLLPNKMASCVEQDSPVLETRPVNDGRFVDVKLKEKKTQLVTEASRSTAHSIQSLSQ